VASCQSLSGTGALKILADFVSKYKKVPVYLSSPTWSNHPDIFKSAGMEIREYAYYNPETKSLDFEGMMRDIEQAPHGSIILL
jgi:aspartate/tyrosine/aromatic aminotransferase